MELLIPRYSDLQDGGEGDGDRNDSGGGGDAGTPQWRVHPILFPSLLSVFLESRDEEGLGLAPGGSQKPWRRSKEIQKRPYSQISCLTGSPAGANGQAFPLVWPAVPAVTDRGADPAPALAGTPGRRVGPVGPRFRWQQQEVSWRDSQVPFHFRPSETCSHGTSVPPAFLQSCSRPGAQEGSQTRPHRGLLRGDGL